MKRLAEFMDKLDAELNGVYPEDATIWAIQRAIRECLNEWALEDSLTEED